MGGTWQQTDFGVPADLSRSSLAPKQEPQGLPSRPEALAAARRFQGIAWGRVKTDEISGEETSIHQL